MEYAVREAECAFESDEVPVGCVITYHNEIIASAHNTSESDMNTTRHAEMKAIEKAISHLGKKDLRDCEMYVTLESCPMCAGAIINTKLKRVYIGAPEPKSGCFGTKIDFNTLGFNHCPEIYIGIDEEKCKDILQKFFKSKR